MRTAVWIPLLATCLLMATGCKSSGVEDGLDFERMVVQPKADAFEPSELFADGKVMRRPPDHVVSRAPVPADVGVRTGMRDSVWIARAPNGYSLEALRLGRSRYDVYCRPCHGADGYAGTAVARAMELQPPRSLHDPEIMARPDGFLYAVITKGYGLMTGYGVQLPVSERWAVVAYVRALQVGQGLRLDALSPDVRDRILRAMPSEGSAPGGSP